MVAGSRSRAAAIRAVVSAAVGRRPLRAVAREIGMSAPGLRSFLDGGNPYPHTLRKLERWAVQTKAADAGNDAATARAAVSFLVADLPPEERTAARAGILNLLVERYRVASTPAPSWLLRLDEQFAEEG